jgi:hypothetical protein
MIKFERVHDDDESKKRKSANAQQIYGYNGKILRIDLSAGESTNQPWGPSLWLPSALFTLLRQSS